MVVFIAGVFLILLACQAALCVLGFLIILVNRLMGD